MTISNPLHYLGISGSLRYGSYNEALLRAAADLLPPGVTLEIFDLSPLPMYNPDNEKPFPEIVVEFRERLAQADALLIASPEYNGSISGALKNAIDWASRPPRQPLSGKPVAIMGASTGNFGTLRAQMHLRQILTHVGAFTLAKPEVLVARASQVFDAEGNLVDEAARGFLRDLLAGLARWTQQVSPGEGLMRMGSDQQGTIQLDKMYLTGRN
jgi:chromate reductase